MLRRRPQPDQRGAQRTVNVTDAGIGKGLQVFGHARREHLGAHRARAAPARGRETPARPPAGSRRLLDRIGRQRHPLGATQDREQDLDSLARLHPGIQTDMPGEGAAE